MIHTLLLSSMIEILAPELVVTQQIDYRLLFKSYWVNNCSGCNLNIINHLCLKNQITPLFNPKKIPPKFAQANTCPYICKHLLAYYESQKRRIPGHSRPHPKGHHQLHCLKTTEHQLNRRPIQCQPAGHLPARENIDRLRPSVDQATRQGQIL